MEIEIWTNLVIIWAKFDIREMNEILLLPMWHLELYRLIVYCLPKCIDFNEKIVPRFRGLKKV